MNYNFNYLLCQAEAEAVEAKHYGHTVAIGLNQLIPGGTPHEMLNGSHEHQLAEGFLIGPIERQELAGHISIGGCIDGIVSILADPQAVQSFADYYCDHEQPSDDIEYERRFWLEPGYQLSFVKTGGGDKWWAFVGRGKGREGQSGLPL